MGNTPIIKKPIVITPQISNVDKSFIRNYNVVFGEDPTITNIIIEHDSIILVLYTQQDIDNLNITRINDNMIEVNVVGGTSNIITREIFVILAHAQDIPIDEPEDISESILKKKFNDIYEFNEYNLYTKNYLWEWKQIFDSIKRNFGRYSSIINNNNSNRYNIQPTENIAIRNIDPDIMEGRKGIDEEQQEILEKLRLSRNRTKNRNYFDDELFLILATTIDEYLTLYDQFLQGYNDALVNRILRRNPYIGVIPSKSDPSLLSWRRGTRPITGNNVIYLYDYFEGELILDLGRTVAVDTDHFIINSPIPSNMVTDLIPENMRTYGNRFIPFATRVNPVISGSKKIQGIKIYRLYYNSSRETVTYTQVYDFEDNGAYLVIYFPVLNRNAMNELYQQREAGFGPRLVYEGLGLQPIRFREVEVNLGNTDETNINIIMNEELKEQEEAKQRVLEQEKEGNNVNFFEPDEETDQDIEAYYRLYTNLPEIEEETKEEADNTEDIETVLALSLRKVESMFAYLLALPQTVKDNIPYFGNPNIENAVDPDVAGNIAAMNPGLVDKLPDWLFGDLPAAITNRLRATNQLNDLISERYINPTVLAARRNIPYFNTAFWWTMNRYNRITDNSAIVRMLIPVLMTTGLYLLLPSAKDDVVRITNDFINRNAEKVLSGEVTPEYLRDLLSEYDNDVKGLANVLGLVTLPITSLIDFVGSSVIFNINKGLSFVTDNNQFIQAGGVNTKLPMRFAPPPSDDDGGDDYDDFGDKKPRLPIGDRPIAPGSANDGQLAKQESSQKPSVSGALSILSELTSLSLSALGLIVNAASVVGSGIYWVIAGLAGLAYLWINRK